MSCSFTVEHFRQRMKGAGEPAAEAGLTGRLVTPGLTLGTSPVSADRDHERITLLVVHISRDPVMIVPR